MPIAFRIHPAYFTAGCEVEDGICTRAAPIIQYMVGWSAKAIRLYCMKKGWAWTEIPAAEMDVAEKGG